MEHKYVGPDKKHDLHYSEIEANICRSYYTVKYAYNNEVEYFGPGYSAYIWGDNGKVFKVMFGNGHGYYDLDKPMTRAERDDMVMSFFAWLPATFRLTPPTPSTLFASIPP